MTVSNYHMNKIGPARRTILTGGLATCCVAGIHAQTTPRLRHIAAATVGAADFKATVTAYESSFGYRVVEDGVVAATLAASWGAPDTAGRKFAVLQSANGEPSYIRIVQIDAVPGFRAITTLGWNSIELAANDPDAVHATLPDSPFRVIGAPAQLAAFPTVRAMQAIGPAEEVVHLTSEHGAPTFVPLTAAPVGRPFILVLAVPNVAAATEWYATRFALKPNPIRTGSISTISNAQNLPADQRSDATFLAFNEPMNFLELWGFSGAAAVARPRAKRQLPPGVALASFVVDSLDQLGDVAWIMAPASRPGLIYGGSRAATFTGPSGELVELIEGG
ncbi:MAG: VOC family protein [Alphaproteobacteria bacterium]|nr:VOC family protein [Alphaproteobacteria bacterium]